MRGAYPSRADETAVAACLLRSPTALLPQSVSGELLQETSCATTVSLSHFLVLVFGYASQSLL